MSTRAAALISDIRITLQRVRPVKPHIRYSLGLFSAGYNPVDGDPLNGLAALLIASAAMSCGKFSQPVSILFSISL